MEQETRAQRGSAAIIAARVGSTRLIDNLILGEDDQD
jgi:pantothenate synthetase